METHPGDVTLAKPQQQTPTFSRIPRLQRSASFHEQTRRKSSDASIAAHRLSVSSYQGQSSPSDRDATPMNDEQLEALDSFSLSSIGSAVSCSVPSNSYTAALRSSSEHLSRNRRAFKYTVHCHSSSMNGNPSDYLTPTQRANQTIRRLKSLLSESQSECHYKDFEIQRLTRELVQLRLEHGQCAAGGKRSVAEGLDPSLNGPSPSLADSGHFDDLNAGRHSSKESLADKEVEGAATVSTPQNNHNNSWASEKKRLITFHMEQMNDLKRQHTDEVQKIRGRLTDKLEQALEQLSDSNGRYADLMSSYERHRHQLDAAESEGKALRETKERLEKQVMQFQADLDERETQEYEIREKDIVEIDDLTKQLSDQSQRIRLLESSIDQLTRENQQLRQHRSAATAVTSQNSVPVRDACDGRDSCVTDLMEQLKSATAQLEKFKETSEREPAGDAVITLQFLRSAVFYLLTDHDNASNHLRAVQNILRFSSEERAAVDRVVRQGYLL